jgi:hypothetical protein
MGSSRQPTLNTHNAIQRPCHPVGRQPRSANRSSAGLAAGRLWGGCHRLPSSMLIVASTSGRKLADQQPPVLATIEAYHSE